MTLFRQFFFAHLKGLLIWMAVGALLALSGTRSAGMFIESNSLEAMPQALLSLFGDIAGMNPVDAYLALATGKGMTLIPTLYAVMIALSVVTREVDRRTVEFLLALPVQRTQLLLARGAVLVVNVTAVVAAIWAVYRFDMAALGYQVTPGHLEVLFVNLWLLAMAVGAIALAASMWIDDYSVGVKLFLGITSLAYFVEFGLRAANVSRAGRLFSPFSYIDLTGVMRSGSVAATDAIVLAVAIAAGVAVSFWAFTRKQFSA